MRAVVQRVNRAEVEVDREKVGIIGRGLLVLVGIEHGDSAAEVQAMANKLAGLRAFTDAQGKMNLDLAEVGGEFLVVSQFTLAASLARGRRPSFDRAAPPAMAEPLVASLIAQLQASGFRVAGGRFGADMKVRLENDGPVTFWLEAQGGRIL